MEVDGNKRGEEEASVCTSGKWSSVIKEVEI